MSNVPDDLRYTAEHEYVARTGDPAVVRIGITDYAQGELGDVVFVNLPKPGQHAGRARVVRHHRGGEGGLRAVQPGGRRGRGGERRARRRPGGGQPRSLRRRLDGRPCGCRSELRSAGCSRPPPTGPTSESELESRESVVTTGLSTGRVIDHDAPRAWSRGFFVPDHRRAAATACVIHDDHRPCPRRLRSPEIDVLHPGPLRLPPHRPPAGGPGGDARRRVGLLARSTTSSTRSCRAEIRLRRPLALPPGRSEREVLQALRGPGRHEPGVPLLHRPGLRRARSRRRWSSATCWRTPAGTPPTRPYQAEIAQGRLEALLNFQTMVSDLTGPRDRQRVAARRGHRRGRGDAPDAGGAARRRSRRSTWWTSTATRRPSRWCGPGPRRAGSAWRSAEPETFTFGPGVIGALVQYPATDGAVRDFRSLCERAHAAGRAGDGGDRPAEPDAAHRRRANGAPTSPWATASGSACRWATAGRTPRSSPRATRTSASCPAGSSAFAGPRRPAGAPHGAADPRAAHPARQGDQQRLHRAGAAGRHGQHVRRLSRAGRPPPDRRAGARAAPCILANALRRLRYRVVHDSFFDTLCVEVPEWALPRLLDAARTRHDQPPAAAADPALHRARRDRDPGRPGRPDRGVLAQRGPAVHAGGHRRSRPSARSRRRSSGRSAYLAHPVFHLHHSETEMLRYIKRLEARDLSLTERDDPARLLHHEAQRHDRDDAGELARVQPAASVRAARPGRRLRAAVPPARVPAGRDHRIRGGVAPAQRRARRASTPACSSSGPTTAPAATPTAPSASSRMSAHGTNPASAVMAGMQVVAVKSDAHGNIDVDDLRAKAAAHRDTLAALMVTYPVHPRRVRGIDPRDLPDRARARRPGVHGRREHERAGGALPPGRHRRRRLPPEPAQDLLHPARRRRAGHGTDRRGEAPRAVPARAPDRGPRPRRRPAARSRAAPWGSAAILPISLGLHRAHGLRRADRGDQDRDPQRQLRRAAARAALSGALHRAATGWWRTSASSTPGRSRRSAGIEVEDIAKRIIDYGFHPPTVSFPVPGTLMIEPTESESKEELDRFCDAMIAIREEIREIEEGRADREHNLLTNAPHTLEQVIADGWDRPYPRERAAYPVARGARAQGLAHGGPDRQRVRRPEPGVRLPAGGGVCVRRRPPLQDCSSPIGSGPTPAPPRVAATWPSTRPCSSGRRRASGGSGSTRGSRTASRSGATSRPHGGTTRSAIEALGLAVVRRPTGGRAVWHAGELTYAVAAPAEELGSLARRLRRDPPRAARRRSTRSAPRPSSRRSAARGGVGCRRLLRAAGRRRGDGRRAGRSSAAPSCGAARRCSSTAASCWKTTRPSSRQVTRGEAPADLSLPARAGRWAAPFRWAEAASAVAAAAADALGRGIAARPRRGSRDPRARGRLERALPRSPPGPGPAPPAADAAGPPCYIFGIPSASLTSELP